MRLNQCAWFCRCGASELYARGLCRRCYDARSHSFRKFEGLRDKVLQRDKLCTSCGGTAEVVHHRRHAGGSLRTYVSLCRACHTKLHHIRRLRCGYLNASLEQLWLEQHKRQAQQLVLPAFTPGSRPEVQTPLF